MGDQLVGSSDPVP